MRVIFYSILLKLKWTHLHLPSLLIDGSSAYSGHSPLTHPAQVIAPNAKYSKIHFISYVMLLLNSSCTHMPTQCILSLPFSYLWFTVYSFYSLFTHTWHIFFSTNFSSLTHPLLIFYSVFTHAYATHIFTIFSSLTPHLLIFYSCLHEAYLSLPFTHLWLPIYSYFTHYFLSSFR